jgi:hypothetical protein
MTGTSKIIMSSSSSSSIVCLACFLPVRLLFFFSPWVPLVAIVVPFVAQLSQHHEQISRYN